MPEIHVRGNRIYSASRGHGVLVLADELALLEEADGVAFVHGAAIGVASYDPNDATGAMTLTNDGRLRVDTKPTDETVNPFAAPSPFDGSPWSRKNPWC